MGLSESMVRDTAQIPTVRQALSCLCEHREIIRPLFSTTILNDLKDLIVAHKLFDKTDDFLFFIIHMSD